MNHKPPFDSAKLDTLLLSAGMDCILATSRHAAQYALGGYYPHLFYTSPTMGLSGYLPVVGYVQGRLDMSFFVGNIFIGNLIDMRQLEESSLWVSEITRDAWTSADSGEVAGRLLRRRGMERGRVGLEMSHLPADALATLTRELPQATFVDASHVLEELRAIKTPSELETLRGANLGVVEAILASLAGSLPGISKQELQKQLRVEDAKRDLTFHHGLTAAAPSLIRTPNDDAWLAGAALSIDHGAARSGYFGDVARMAVLGEPTSELRHRLAEVESVQQAAMHAVRPGVHGQSIFEAAALAQAECPHAADMFFIAHGIGLNQHEAPRLTDFGFDAGPGGYEHRPLARGMVISIETQMSSQSVGLVKTEDSVAITASGFELLADLARDWIVIDL